APRARRERLTELYFFFQAEDGIRDRNVTGVQSCALPIYDVGHGGVLDDAGNERLAAAGDEAVDKVALAHELDGRLPAGVLHEHRSEERRVGKERRSRWAPDAVKEG